MELTKFHEVAQTIVTNAIKESAIEKEIEEIAGLLKTMDFKLTKRYDGSKDNGFILGSVDDLIQILEDNIIKLQNMKNSKFIEPFLSTVQKWEVIMRKLLDVIEVWTELERKWLHLGGIFIRSDIRTQLPNEVSKFDEIDDTYKQTMLDTSKKLNVYDCCTIAGRKEAFVKLISGLDKCRKSLSEYLNTKRFIVPRFNFLSDDELLEALGQRGPVGVQKYIGKIFDNLEKFRLEEQKINDVTRIICTGIISCENEIMEFKNPIVILENVEEWMVILLKEMKYSNRYLTKKAIYDYGKSEKPRIKWLLNFQGMIIFVANQIWWTAEIEDVFLRIKQGKKRAMKKYLIQLNNQLNEVVKLMGEESLTNNDRKKLNTVLTIDVHARDVVDEFVRDCIINAEEFKWESQLRFYWCCNLDNVWINQCTGSFEYGYEYMGLNGRLVITPLTDRIYLTITQALSMHLGLSLAGPAGTGKTETVKNLARTFGLLCIVTNCSDGLDHVSIGKILGGLIQCGAWGCFDGFNNVDESVLSIISSQFQTIRLALQQKATRFMFGTQDIGLDSKCGVFITMTTSNDYRTRLPESLKVYFRPIVVIMPDNELICQIKLFSAGFLTAKVLAKKMTVLYSLAKDQLSNQAYYDFGLRALISVLTMAGHLKKISDLPENVILLQALKDTNLPKFITDDVPIFLGLLKDLFSGLDCGEIEYPLLKKTAENVLAKHGFIILPEQVNKILQLYKLMMTTHAIMIVGPTGGGKSVIIKTLWEVQKSLNNPTKWYVLNAKAYTVSELYGTLNPLTREWNDGLLSNIFRKINEPDSSLQNEKRCILFDGDVDSSWIENINSVMDNNKTLTLSNQERIKLQDNCSLLFEVGNLQYASPASVSRVGMVYVDPENLGYEPYVNKWIKSRCEYEQEYLKILYKKYIPGAVKLIIDGMLGSQQVNPLQMIIHQNALNLVTQLSKMIDSLYPSCHKGGLILEYNRISGNDEKLCIHKAEDKNDLLEAVFIQSCYCSLGAALVAEAQYKFDDYIKKTSGLMMIEDTPEKLATIYHIPITCALLYDYVLDVENKVWRLWKSLIPQYIHDRNKNFSEIFVPTTDTLRVTWFIRLMNNLKQSVLLVGETGTSKTATVEAFLRSLDAEKFAPLKINFSLRTTSMDIQKNIESRVEKRTRDLYSPPLGRTLLVFIDDISLPMIDMYGTQPIALLKLLLEYGGFYDRHKDFNWKQIKDIWFLSAMEARGKNTVDLRFLSLLFVYNIPCPNDTNLNYIYTSILAGHLSIFSEKIQAITNVLIEIIIELYKMVRVKLPPTPSKFHYIFNMRDLSKICVGLLQSTPNCFSIVPQFVRLWRNEITRIFCDRLITEEDRSLVQKHLELKIKSVWSENPDVVENTLRDPLLFGDFRNAFNEDEIQVYEDVLDYEAVYNLFIEILELYNEKHSKLSMILFNDALEHLIRVHRILKIHRGHVLIVGVSGSGKQSLIRLASFAAKCDIFEISLNHGYNETSFHNDMKKLFNLVGIENKKITFLLTSTQIIDENFLEMINNILTTGIPFTLFTEEEIDRIINTCRTNATQAGYGSTKESIWSYFTNNSSSNLHIAFSMSPADDIFKMRCRDYLGIIKCTTIDWVCSWPQKALFTVANVLLKNDECISAEHRENIVLHIVSVHVGVEIYTLNLFRKYRRNNYVTPKHFIGFINTFLELLTKKKKFVNFQCNRLSAGLKKITEASENLVQLNDTLSVQSTEVIELTKECDALVTSIEKLEKIISQTKETNLKKKDELIEKNKITAKELVESKKVFADVLLELDTSKKALKTLTNSDVAEFKSFPTPPQPIQIVGECLAIIKGSEEISWEGVQNLVSDSNFLEFLQELDIHEIMTKQRQLMKTCLKKCDELDQLKSISKAGFTFYKFLLAVLHYSEVYQNEQDKSERLQKFKIESEHIYSLLRKEENELEELEKQLAEVNVKYEATLCRKDKLQEEINVSHRNLSLADELVNTLSSESERWEKELKCLQDDYESIIGDCLLSSGFLIYCGPFPSEFRNKMVYNDWLKSITEKNIPLSKIFRLENQLTNDVEMRGWNSQGLPQDEFSTQNAILTMYSTKFALCIDPHNQALNWLKKKEKKNLKIVSFYNKKYIKDLEVAIENGFPIIFQDVDYFDYILDNVIEKNIQSVNDRSFVILGDKKIEYNANFRVYFMTKISNPNFDPAMYSKATVINFMVTMVGLENQLLSIVVQSEKKDVEEKKDKLVIDIGENKGLIQKLENTILREISTSEDNLLDNINLMKSMEDFKTSTSEAVKKIDQDTVAATDVNRLRNDYRPVATRGAILFFVLVDLAAINPMYQYSFSSYLKLFKHSLTHAPFSSSFSERLENIIQTLTANIYDYGCMGIFEKHKILLSFHMATKIELSSGKISQEEFNFFIKKNVAVNNLPENPIFWLPPSGLEDILKLSAEFTEFSDLYDELQVHSDDWHEWFQSDTPELIPCPGQYSKKLRAFQKLMLLKCFRVDRVRCEMINYISECLGEKFITSRILSFDLIYEQSDSTIPVIFILSPGTEPTSELIKFAELYEFRAGKFQNLFLGQGQEEKAVGLLENAMSTGQWLVLQNCHLLLEFIRRLEEKIDTFTKPHPDFRLWLTTELSKNFPIGFLQRSLKVVSESPSGLKLNLKNTYIKMEDENLENFNHPNYKHLVYVLAFFHAIIQERKKYGKIGWTLDYDFSDSDLALSMSTVKTYLSKLSPTNNFPWNSLKYMIGEVIYGGKVIDSYDRRIFGVYMDEYFGDFLFDASHPFHFYNNNDTVYVIPPISNKNDYIEFIENLSPGDSPEIFGLNSNAEIDYFIQSMTDMLINLNDIQPQRSDSPSISNREELVNNIATDLLTKIPPEYNMTKVRNNFGLAVTPLVIVLFQELERFNKLIKKMNTTLTQLKKAIAGEINVNKTLESLLDSLHNGLVPKEWEFLAPATKKNLASWINHLNKRTDQYTEWSGSNEPIVLWLSGLNNPKSYLAAFFQMTCRKNNWPLDKSSIYTQVSKFSRVDEVEERLHQGCYVHGLYLEGASWDVNHQCLKKSYPKVKLDELPVLSVITKESHNLTLERTVKTPVYVTSDRQNAMGEGLVFEADLRTTDHNSLWILQGLCLLLNVD